MSANEVLAWIRCQEEVSDEVDFIALGTRSPWRQVIRFAVSAEGKISVSIGPWKNGQRPQRLMSSWKRSM